MKLYINEINQTGKIAVDDTILIKGVPTTAGSRMLESFKPLFSAEAVEKLEKAGYAVSGKTNVGEFGLDLLGETSYFGAVEKDGTLVGAAAELVKEEKVQAALCVDLNGSPRRAAAVSGVDFIKPTYGTVSRYGVVACACSGEQIGVTAKTAEGIKEILSVISGHDDKDGTSLPEEKYDYSTEKDVSKMKVCLAKELYESASDEVKAKLDSYVQSLKELGAVVETVSLEIASAAQSAWQILLSAETCNNLSRFDGVKYGYRTADYKNIDELYVKSRTESMGFLTKATIIYGSDVLSKGRYDVCYDKALRVRSLVCSKLKEIFASYDVILAPACSKTAYKPYDALEAFEKVFEESLYTAIASISGKPSLVTKGIQLIADSFKESDLLSVAHSVEKKEA
ncbi:MAG: hypothetical protein IJ262_08575 [Clostridia bacterium]|nr:hypothetical protein [Clostridia bacterium]